MSIKYYKEGAMGTIFFHIVMGIILLLFGYPTPLPLSLPSEQGILINFGDNDQGTGKNEPATQTQQAKKIESSIPIPDKNNILTQETEEAPVLKEKTTKQKANTEQKKPNVVKETKKEEAKPVEQAKTVNPLALYKKNTGTSEGEGETRGNTNQGSETGSVDSNNHNGGQGGPGNTFSLNGRNVISLPEPEYNYQVGGKVVVEIIVDKYGNVTSAAPGVKGSTTLNNYLLTKAKEAALKAKFDIKTDATAYQKGTITYYFILQ